MGTAFNFHLKPLLGHAGCILPGPRYCHCLHAEGLARPDRSEKPLLSFVLVYAADSPLSWQKEFASSQKSFYTTLKLHFGQCG